MHNSNIYSLSNLINNNLHSINIKPNFKDLLCGRKLSILLLTTIGMDLF